ncbi:MAG: CDP-diacylglycerol--serine O-phosphatidyltransferase, partial [Verrucomicrobiales bacterium]
MTEESENEVKIHLLPNLMTAGNLFCGFIAVLVISKGRLAGGMEGLDAAFPYYMDAVLLIFGACVFDLLDGRLARISGQESAFGREFDSIADVVSFGLVPALLLMDIVLFEFGDTLGQILAFVYLLCGAMRLARFNCVAALQEKGVSRDFNGVPIPAAAGFISSVTLAMLYLGSDHREILSKIKFILPVLMLLVSFLMFSNIKYPSFKNLNWKRKRSVPVVVVAILVVVFTVRYYEWMPAVVFTAYLVYGVVRPSISKRWRREIEELDDDDEVALPDDGGE